MNFGRWSLDTGRVPITTTSRPERLKDILAVPHLAPLAADDVAAISAAGDAAPRRTFWLQCPAYFKQDPREEVEDAREEAMAKTEEMFGGGKLEAMLKGLPHRGPQ